MTKTLKLSEKKALDLYNTGSKELKEILEESFGKDFFRSKAITDIVYNEATLTEYLNLEDESELFIFDKNTKDPNERYINACNIIPKISKIYNEGTLLNWKDPNIYKYCPYKYFSSGSCSVSFDAWGAALSSPGGFYLKNTLLAEKHYQNFAKYWEDYWQVK